jgi:branched-chain amino acid aminotransferase
VGKKNAMEKGDIMLSDRTVYLNGKFVEWEKATVHILSHGFARGSAIFEVMSFHETKKGTAIFRLDEHIYRLFRTAELLSMELPLTKEALTEAVRTTVKANNLASGAIKLVCYYRDIAFEILPPQKTLDVCIVAIDPALDLGGLSYEKPKGLSACVCRWRKLHPETVPIEAKVAANYLNGLMARLDSQKRGFDMAIMVDTEGFVAEGSAESVFFVKDGVLETPILGTVLQSITRKSLLEVAQVMGIETAEKRVRPETLMEADEIFFSCSPQKIAPVRKIENRAIRSVPGPITKKLMTALDDICAGKQPRFKDWLFHVK